ncbi:MAG: hypothetical protein ACU0C9_06140 [Paracoccaceae bacterium]
MAGCDAGGFGVLNSPPQIVRVASKDVAISGPTGYCIDRSATRDSTQGSFVLLGSCASIANNATLAAPQISGVLTASVSDEGTADIEGALDRLNVFLRSEDGRAALARDGNATSVSVISTRRVRGALIVKVLDTSPNDVSGLAPNYWRALFYVQGRIVTLSVNAFLDKPMSDAVGFNTLAEFVASVRRENPAYVDQVGEPV